MPFNQWIFEVNDIFVQKFKITLDDLGIKDEAILKTAHQNKESPQEFVEYYAQKYDLIKAEEFNWA